MSDAFGNCCVVDCLISGHSENIFLVKFYILIYNLGFFVCSFRKLHASGGFGEF
jgi:hypothetical protein